jgi:hypothetical protein
MINENLKTIINNLMYAENQKDLKIKLLKNLKDLIINDNLTQSDYDKLKESFKTIAEYIK